MSEGDKPKNKRATGHVDIGVDGLLSALGDALGQVVSKLETATEEGVATNDSFEFEKGPVRAHGGVRMRMGGLDVGSRPAKAAPPQPINPNRQKSAPSARSTKETARVQPIAFDMFEDDDSWILTADLPGVDLADLQLSAEGLELILRTTGTRQHETRVAIPDAFDPDQAGVSLRNGVLTLTIPKERA